MTNYYYVDTLGTNTTPTNNWTGGLTNLAFAKSASSTYNTTGPIATNNMTFLNVPLATPCPEGGIIWLVWEETLAVSGAQGIAIDNLVFSTGTQPTLHLNQTGSSVVLSWPQMFTGYRLQSNTNLANPGGWQTVSPTPTVIEGMNTVTNAIGGGKVFYRLINP